MKKKLQVARDKNGDLFIYNGEFERANDHWIHISGDYLEIDKNLFPYLKWKDEPIEIYLGDKNVFKSTEEIDKFVEDHIDQMTEKELAFVNSLSQAELYRQGLVEGIMNGLLVSNFDVEHLNGMEPMNNDKKD